MTSKLLIRCDIKGATQTPEYRNWHAMMSRCYNPNNNRYRGYGDRGISVALEWFSFAKFLGDMGMRPTPKSTVERKDNDKSYNKSNCIWLEQSKQINNTSRTRRIYWRGMQMSLKEWAKFLGLNYKMLHNRLKLGWTVERTFSTPKLDSKSFLVLGRCKRAKV